MGLYGKTIGAATATLSSFVSAVNVGMSRDGAFMGGVGIV